MSGENHEGNKSPEICDDDNQRRFLCPRAMKHEATKAYETQGSSGEGAKREGHWDVQGRIRLSLGTTIKQGIDTTMSIGGDGSH
jgi:hypothetical protein